MLAKHPVTCDYDVKFVLYIIKSLDDFYDDLESKSETDILIQGVIASS